MDFINAMLDKMRPKDRMKALERMNSYTQPSAQRQGYEPALCKPLSAEERQRLNPEYAARWMLPPPMTPAEIRTARKALGLTQHGLADALRMGKWGFQSVAKWEKGETPIPGPAQVAIELMVLRQADEGFRAVPRLKLGREE